MSKKQFKTDDIKKKLETLETALPSEYKLGLAIREKLDTIKLSKESIERIRDAVSYGVPAKNFICFRVV